MGRTFITALLLAAAAVATSAQSGGNAGDVNALRSRIERRFQILPIADGVVYEFIEEQTMDHADNLLDAHQLEPGKLYAMVISDGYGLRRYQTDDLFLCRRNGLCRLAPRSFFGRPSSRAFLCVSKP